jgi:hypothetical protein
MPVANKPAASAAASAAVEKAAADKLRHADAAAACSADGKGKLTEAQKVPAARSESNAFTSSTQPSFTNYLIKPNAIF